MLNRISRRPVRLLLCISALLVSTVLHAQETLITESGVLGGRKQLHRIPTSMLTSSNNIVVIYLPPGYEASDQRYPVVYLLNGAGGTYEHFTSWTNGPRKASDLILAGRIQPMILVIPTRPWGSGHHLEFTDYLVQELIPFVDTHYRTIADRSSRGIGGWSLGGGNALVSVLARADVFSAAAGLAVAGMGRGQLRNLALDHRQYLQPVATWLHWGTSDEAAPRPSSTLDLFDQLKIPYSYLETGGDHTTSLRTYTDSALAFLSDHMGPPPPASVETVTESFAVVAGATFEDLDVVVRLHAPLPTGSWLRVDVDDLGMSPVRLTDDGAGRHTARLALPADLALGLHRWPVARVDADGNGEYLYSIRLSVYPDTDARLFDGQAPGWDMRMNSKLTATPGTHHGEQALALHGSGAWSLTWTPPEGLPALGYASLEFLLHPGTATVSDGDEPVLEVRLGTKAVAVTVDLSTSAWQKVSVPLWEFEPADNATIYNFRFSGALNGDFYLADVRLTRQPPPVATAVSERHDIVLPDGFALEPNYPNPFNSSTVIGFVLPQATDVTLTVYDLLGQRVATLVSGTHAAGQYTVRWDGRDDSGRQLASGVYLYQVRTEDTVLARRLALIR
jgi:S-formylglutathione hydrolase FrmB